MNKQRSLGKFSILTKMGKKVERALSKSRIEDSNECKPDARMRSEDELSEIEIDDVPNPSAKKNKGNYECKYCRKKFTRQKTLDTHIVGHGKSPQSTILILSKIQ